MEITQRASFDDYIARGYHPGCIVRVAMRNFLTYSDTVAYPGPELNVVLGPNGTGKSALTHAICLACGGAPKSIGRSDDITQFVKRNSESEGISYCEVDILTRESIRTVRRTINSENKSSKWTMGGRQSSQKDVKDFMASMNIDVDNLNSFMPQDKVGSFTQQTPQGILHKTLQSIVLGDGSGRTLADEQMELAAHQSTTRSKEAEVRAKEQRVQVLKAELQSMESDVQRMRQRNELLELQGLYTIKSAVLEAVACEDLIKDKQKDVDVATARLNEAQAAIVPLESALRDLKREMAVGERQVQAAVKQLEKTESAVGSQQDEVDACSIRIEAAVLALGSLDSARRALEDRLRAAEGEVRRVEQVKAAAEGRIPEHNERLRGLDTDLRAVETEIAESSNEVNVANMQCQEKNDELRSIQRTINNFTDTQMSFLRKAGKFRDVPKVYDWIQNNSHCFRGEVIGPVGMHIKVDSAEVARMVESSVAPKRMMTFLTDSQEDYDLISAELRGKQRLRFNLCCVKHTSDQSGTFSPSQLSDFGRVCGGPVRYLIDEVPAPSHMPVLVRAFLQSFAMFHKVIFVKSDPRSDVDLSRLSPADFDMLCYQESQFMLYTVERSGAITKIDGKKSRYNRSAPVTIVTSDAKPQHLLSVGNSEQEDALAGLLAQQEELKRAMSALNARQEGCRAQQQRLMQRCQEIRQQRSLCQNEIKMVATFKRQLDTEERRVSDMRRQLSTSAEAERERQKATLRQEVKNYKSSLAILNSKLRGGLPHAIAHTVSSHRLRSTRSRCQMKEAELRVAREGLGEFDELKSRAEKARDDEKDRLSGLEEILQETQTKSGGPKKFEKLYARCVDRCPENSFEEIAAKLAEITEIINRSMDNAQLLENYDNTKVSLAEEEIRLSELADQLQHSEEEIHERVRAWKQKVGALQVKLDALFQKFMAELGYHGSVVLRELMGLDTYEIQMNVSFRGEADIAPLSGQRHSGGERAVATIMYLMALQGLTSAPFRVVDEINQGMDERNERLVFDIIVRNSCLSEVERSTAVRKPQYFLVSPKLLQGLRSMESDGVTVLMVWNGPGVIPLQISGLVAGMRTRKRLRNETDKVDGKVDMDGSEHKDGLENGTSKARRLN